MTLNGVCGNLDEVGIRHFVGLDGGWGEGVLLMVKNRLLDVWPFRQFIDCIKRTLL